MCCLNNNRRNSHFIGRKLKEVIKINIAVIDADLIFRSKHSFPNLVCMKLSSYFKSKGDTVSLKLDYEDLEQYDKVFISKVFIDTEIPNEPKDKTLKTEDTVGEFYKDHPILNLPNVQYGGTGFFYDKAPPLQYDIEHTMPDYHLYDDWVSEQIQKGAKQKTFTYYKDYSIGFTTRGCIRGCEFCVNKNYKECVLHSSIKEFIDESKPYVCLLDDNILSCVHWKSVFEELLSSKKRIQFKQGVDERLLTDEKCEYLFKKFKWIGDRIFAFDNIKDKELIENKLQMIRRHTSQQVKFYVFCAFNHQNIGHYDEEFWRKDITDVFERIKILMKYKCLPYIMRYADYKTSPYKGFYINLASWCNQPSQFKKKSFREWCETDYQRGHKSTKRYLDIVEQAFPDLAAKYFDIKFEEINK